MAASVAAYMTAMLFSLGSGVIVTAVLVAWLAPDEISGWILRFLMIPLGLVLALLIVRGIRTTGRSRWLSVLAAGLLLLMFSGFAILSFGMLTLPVAVALLLISITKLQGLRRPR